MGGGKEKREEREGVMRIENECGDKTREGSGQKVLLLLNWRCSRMYHGVSSRHTK